jgi:hypothetical protein
MTPIYINLTISGINPTSIRINPMSICIHMAPTTIMPTITHVTDVPCRVVTVTAIFRARVALIPACLGVAVLVVIAVFVAVRAGAEAVDVWRGVVAELIFIISELIFIVSR